MLSLFKVFMSKDVDQPLLDVLHSGYITQGKKVEEFESALQKWFDYPYILTLNSATSGLTLALRMLNLDYGDEVLCTPLTCTATNWAVLANYLSIKWVDVDPKTCNMDLDDLEKKITVDTKAILIVHWGGSPCDLDRLNDISQRHNLPVIEDCAHSFGAEYKGKKIGTSGNYCVFSLQAIKHLTTGDGGLIFLPGKKEYDRAKLLRWYGIDRENKDRKDFRLENDVPQWGYKFHMNDINATIGLANLPHIQKLLEKARDNVSYYKEHLSSMPGVELLEETPSSKSVYWIFTIKVSNKTTFIPFMNQSNIMVSQVHNRNDYHSCVNIFKRDLPQLDSLEKHIIAIPCGWWVTKDDRAHVVQTIREWSNTYYKISLLQEEDMEEYVQLINYSEEEASNLLEKYLRITSSPQSVYVLRNNDKIVATGKLFVEPKLYNSLGHIEDVVVDEEYQGYGYGKVLVDFLLKEARNAKCYKVVLNCTEKNVKFYEKCTMHKEGVQMVL